MTHPLVLLSGGLDSTYLLWKLLQDGPVEVIYIDGQQPDNKIQMETFAVRKVIEWCNENSPFSVVRYTKVTCHTTHLSHDHKFGQPIAWMLGAVSFATGKDHSYVAMSYVAGDQIACHIPDMEAAWKLLSSIVSHYPVELRIPLKFTTKDKIWDEMPKALRKLTWTCETPTDDFEQCGRCVACLTQMSVKYRMKVRNGKHQKRRNKDAPETVQPIEEPSKSEDKDVDHREEIKHDQEQP
jgi:7-cyano-7-deazaguanine synthase in queuosine biosynthesis